MFEHKYLIEELLTPTGITINGSNPWDIRIKDDRTFSLVLSNKNLGLGEAYVAGWWDCQRLDEFFCRVLKAGIDKKVKAGYKFLLHVLSASLFNRQSKKRARIVAEQHYDLDNELFTSFLDAYNQYSCAYFEGTADLEDAQIKKMELICKKLHLQQNDHVLDIGLRLGGPGAFIWRSGMVVP